ncbi:MAG TPA: sugar transferase, partial [Anaerolineaceae bacterium]
MASPFPAPPIPLSKRLLDLALTVPGLVLISPVFGLTALAVFLADGRPVFFAQPRSGRGGEPFNVLKFRTMTCETDAAGRLLPDDARLHGWGRFLRATSLDELPELINVLRGEMS